MIDRRTAILTGAAAMALPGLAAAQRSPTGLFVNAVGTELTSWKPNFATGALTKLSSLKLPAGIQFGWRHPTANVIYLGLANDAGGFLAAVKFDAAGSLSLIGEPQPCGRPIHIQVHPNGRWVLVAVNTPAHPEVYPIRADYTAGPMVAQTITPPYGIFGHQVRVLPNGRAVVLVTRGVRSTKDQNKDPGGLRFFDFDPATGKLAYTGSVARNGGYGFGPRDVDFSLDGRFAYLSLELQNQLLTYRVLGNSFSDNPLATEGSIPNVTKPYEQAGMVLGDVHMHPKGHSVYSANRSSLFTKPEEAVDSIAHFKINPRTGAAILAGQYATNGQHPRTFFIDGTGRMLVAANVRLGPGIVNGKPEAKAPINLNTYTVAADGSLKQAQSYEIAGTENQMWCAFI